MCKTKNLKFQYKNKEYTFNFIDINLKKQVDVLILEKSGIGKTTFLHLLEDLLKPSEGKNIYNGLFRKNRFLR